MQLLFRALKNWALQVHVAKDNSFVGDDNAIANANANAYAYANDNDNNGN